MNRIDSPKDAVKRFGEGQIGIFPTDTAYGIGCRIDNVDSIKKIYALRNRPAEKALLALVSSVEMAREYVFINPEVEELVEHHWPGGLTIIFECHKEKVPGVVRAEGDTLAIRMPNHRELLEIIEKVGVPIVAPSANMSGNPTPYSVDEVDPDLQESVDFVLTGMCTMKGVSTIIDATKIPYEIVRQGVVNV